MAWTQADIDSLKAAIASGVTRVRYADRDVSYRSLEEMRETLRLLQGEVSPSTRVRQFRTYTRKGL